MNDKEKKQKKEALIARGGGIILILGFIYFAFIRDTQSSSTTPMGQDNTVAETKLQYYTKLEALEAKEREQKNRGEGEYLRNRDNVLAIDDSVIDEEQTMSIEEKTEPISMQSEPISEPIPKTQRVQPRKAESSPQLQKLREVAQRTPKDEQPGTPTGEQVAPKEEDARAKRLAAMRQAWGQNTGSTQSATSSVSAKAVIHGTQELSAGEIATLRLTEDMSVEGRKIPRNTIFSGAVSFSNNRVLIAVNSIRMGNDIIPVKLSVFGADGHPGLPTNLDVAGSTTSDEIGKEAANQARRYGGVVGGITGAVIGAVSREKKLKVTLFDAQTIFIR